MKVTVPKQKKICNFYILNENIEINDAQLQYDREKHFRKLQGARRVNEDGKNTKYRRRKHKKNQD